MRAEAGGLLLVVLRVLAWRGGGSRPSPGVARFTRAPCVLRPRDPDDCPDCRRSAAGATGQDQARPSPRPWREGRSRRGAPKRVATDGFACPNAACAYYGVTDAQIHALVGDGAHGCY